jgi:hypothetical protein
VHLRRNTSECLSNRQQGISDGSISCFIPMKFFLFLYIVLFHV